MTNKPQSVIYSTSAAKPLAHLLASLSTPGAPVFIITDTNVERLVLPALTAAVPALADARVIAIVPGDDHKNPATLVDVWTAMSAGGATRRSLVVNIGGGVVTDLGGFAASTFKRGVPFINVPTTLLAAVDAAIGGKTGVNLGSLKNEVGVFSPADAVVISTASLATLPRAEVLSGWAEMLKHALLSDARLFTSMLDTDPLDIDPGSMLGLLRTSVEVKRAIVAADPTEQGIRRHLNLGHTAGHAVETLAMRRLAPVPHGFAVAWGILVAMIISAARFGFPSSLISSYAAAVRRLYGPPPVGCDDYPALIELMGHDKKNAVAGRIAFTLLHDAGSAVAGVVATPDEIKNALDIARDLLGA